MEVLGAPLYAGGATRSASRPYVKVINATYYRRLHKTLERNLAYILF
jgi:hypothetical protein